MAGDTVQQVKDKLSIVDVVSSYVKLTRAGNAMRARCPFHSEKTPSFFVSPERGTYHCFGCNVGGDIFSFVQAIEGTDFKGALKILAERAGVPIEFTRGQKGEKDERDRLRELMEASAIFYINQLDDKHAARAYLKKRGLTDETIKDFRIGFAPAGWHETTEYLKKQKFTESEIVESGMGKKGDRGVYDRFRSRIMFPITDTAGRIVAFSGRIFPLTSTGQAAKSKDEMEAPKYINSPETVLYKKSNILFGFDRAKQSIRKHNFAILVEGQMDLIMVHQAGFCNAVAVSGTAFTDEHANLLKRMTENLVISLDADEAGIKAAARAARAALGAGLHVKIAQLPLGKDPADVLLEKEGEEKWRGFIRGAKDIITFLLDTLEERSKDRLQFRRAVEVSVVPFLSEIPSPIERESYVRQIAQRLSVSESAIAETLARIPEVPQPISSQDKHHPAPKRESRAHSRLSHAAGILLWQESLAKPHLELAKLIGFVEQAVGIAAMKEVRALPPAEAEALRFSAESLYGSSKVPEYDIITTLVSSARERLQEELAENTAALKISEAAGDDEKTAEILAKSKLLTEQLARLTKEG